MLLPGNGSLSLQGHSRPGDTVNSKPKQAMIVRMSAETLEELESFPHQPPMEFEFGEHPGIHIGDTFFPMRPLKEGTPHELYLRVSSAAKPMAPLKLYANVIGKFTVERELQEKIQAQLRDRTREEEKLRRGHKTQWLETPPDLHTTNGKKRKAPQASMFRKPPTDFLRPGNASTPSSARPLSPAPLPSSSTKESFAPTRKRLIQCLAVSERTTDEAVKLVGGGDPDSSWRRDFMNLLGDVAEQTAPVKKGGDTSIRPWRLKAQTWLEVRPYEWPRLSETDRTNMARRARMSLKHLNIPESDPAWTHVKYRAPSPIPPIPPANLDKSNASVRGPSKTGNPNGTAKSDAPKRGVSSKDVKEKKAQAKADSARSKAEVLMKDESKLSARINSTVTEKGTGATASASSTSGEKQPMRRGPGSGYRVSKSSSQDRDSRGVASINGQNPSPVVQKHVDARMKDREAPAPTLPAKPPIAMSPPVPNQDGKNAGSSTSASRIKRPKEPAVSGLNSDRQLDGNKERERQTGRGHEETARERPRDKEDTSAGVKRKKPARDGDEDWVHRASIQKKRKTEESLLSSTASSSREPEPRTRDLSLPKKPDISTVPHHSKNRKEPSPTPVRTKVKKEREGSPFTSTVRPKVRREPSPLPPTRTSAVSHPKGSSESSQRHTSYQAERATKANGATYKTRRKSPIYTSSEDEGDVRRPNTTSVSVSQVHASNPHTHVRPRPSLPASTDRAGLRARYSSSYLEYLTSFQQVLAQRRKIEHLLEVGIGNGSAESTIDSDGGVELMDADELVRLSAEHRSLKEELEGIQRMFTRSGKRGSLSD